VRKINTILRSQAKPAMDDNPSDESSRSSSFWLHREREMWRGEKHQILTIIYKRKKEEDACQLAYQIQPLSYVIETVLFSCV